MKLPAIKGKVKDVNVLQWWQAREKEWPLLCKVVKQYLCIQASSTSSERTFSTSGNTVTNKRTKLDPENVHMIVYCKENIPKINIQKWLVVDADTAALEKQLDQVEIDVENAGSEDEDSPDEIDL
jgi:hypothetical protein